MITILTAIRSDLPLRMKLQFVAKSLTVWPYWTLKVKYGGVLTQMRWALKQRYFQVQRLWKLTRDNMTSEEMAADDAVWADWFQDRSWEAMKASQEERPALKARIDFMAKQRIIGMSFPVAEKAFAKTRLQ